MCSKGSVDRVKKTSTFTRPTRFWNVMENTPRKVSWKVMENHRRCSVWTLHTVTTWEALVTVNDWPRVAARQCGGRKSELTTCRLQVRLPDHYATEPHWSFHILSPGCHNHHHSIRLLWCADTWLSSIVTPPCSWFACNRH